MVGNGIMRTFRVSSTLDMLDRDYSGVRWHKGNFLCSSHILNLVVVNHCFMSLFGPKGLLSDIVIR